MLRNINVFEGSLAINVMKSEGWFAIFVMKFMVWKLNTKIFILILLVKGTSLYVHIFLLFFIYYTIISLIVFPQLFPL